MTSYLIKLISRVLLACTIMVIFGSGVGHFLREDEIMLLGKSGKTDFEIYRIALNRNLIMPIAYEADLNSSLSNAVWSPDGQQIAFVSQRLNQQHTEGSIYIADAEGRNQKLIIANLDCVYNLSWSPDGQQLAVIRGCYPTSVLMTIHLKQETNSYLTNNVSDGYAPHWSPDGQQISFRYSENNRSMSEIYNINIQNGNITRLTANLPNSLSPTISPDGRYVIFVNKLPGSTPYLYSIYLYDLANQQTILLYKNEKYITSSIDWSSDSHFIVYAAGSFDELDLLTLDIATCLEKPKSCVPKQVVLTKGQYVVAHWRPR